MKMIFKMLKATWVTVLSSCFFVSCTKDCKQATNSLCNISAPTDGVCQAYFESWFYNKSMNTCEKVGYSGCSAKGFETKKDCEQCKCKSK